MVCRLSWLGGRDSDWGFDQGFRGSVWFLVVLGLNPHTVMCSVASLGGGGDERGGGGLRLSLCALVMGGSFDCHWVNLLPF